MADIYYVDGQFVHDNEASIPVNDLAMLRGYGVFDFLRTYHGKPFHLEGHVDRLFRSAELVGISMPWSRQDIQDIVKETLEHNPNHPESNVRIVVTGGWSSDFITPGDQPRLVVLCTAAKPPADHYYTDGAKIITVRESRYLPLAKSINYISAILALKEARQQDAVEAIYVTESTHALEGTTTNLFAFQGDTVITPEENILPGITRGVVLDILKTMFTVEIRDLHLEELYGADEVFITASNKQVMPIVEVDDKTIGTGKPGERTQRVMQAFGALTGVPLPMKV